MRIMLGMVRLLLKSQGLAAQVACFELFAGKTRCSYPQRRTPRSRIVFFARMQPISGSHACFHCVDVTCDTMSSRPRVSKLVTQDRLPEVVMTSSYFAYLSPKSRELWLCLHMRWAYSPWRLISCIWLPRLTSCLIGMMKGVWANVDTPNIVLAQMKGIQILEKISIFQQPQKIYSEHQIIINLATRLE